MYKITFANGNTVKFNRNSEINIHPILDAIVKQFLNRFEDKQVEAILAALPADSKLDANGMVVLMQSNFNDAINSIKVHKATYDYVEWLKDTYNRLTDIPSDVIDFDNFCEKIRIDNIRIITALQNVGVEIDNETRDMLKPTEEQYYEYGSRAFGMIDELYETCRDIYFTIGMYDDEIDELDECVVEYPIDWGYEGLNNEFDTCLRRNFPNLRRLGIPDCTLGVC